MEFVVGFVFAFFFVGFVFYVVAAAVIWAAAAAVVAVQALIYVGLVIACDLRAGWRGETIDPTPPPWPWRWP